jgi:transposase
MLKLSESELAELKSFMRKTKEKEEYRRTEAVLYKAQGLSYRAIARRMDASYKSVYDWIKRYKAGGVEALRTKPPPGSKPRITPGQRKIIANTALKGPRAFGYLKNEWSMRLLSKHLTRELGIKVSKSHVCDILHGMGIAYKRPKSVVKSPDPDYGEKASKVEGYKRISLALLKKGLR